MQGLETLEPSHFITPTNVERLQQAKEANRVQVLFMLHIFMYHYFLPETYILFFDMNSDFEKYLLVVLSFCFRRHVHPSYKQM